MHYLVAVAPVVKQAWAKSLWNLDDVHQSTQHSKSIHDDEEAQGVGTADPVSVNPEQEEAEAEQSLPGERLQPPDVCAGCGGVVDAVGREEDVGQQGGLLHGRVAEKGNVYDWKGPYKERARTSC